MELPRGLQTSDEDRRIAQEAVRVDEESLKGITVFISQAAASNAVGPDALLAIRSKIKSYRARFGEEQTERLLHACYRELRNIRRTGLLQDEESRFRAEELVHLIFEGEIH